MKRVKNAVLAVIPRTETHEHKKPTFKLSTFITLQTLSIALIPAFSLCKSCTI